MAEIIIRNKVDAEKCIGQQVWWDDEGSRYTLLRTGILEEWFRRQVCIDGNWRMMNQFKNLRNFKGKQWE